MGDDLAAELLCEGGDDTDDDMGVLPAGAMMQVEDISEEEDVAEVDEGEGDAATGACACMSTTHSPPVTYVPPSLLAARCLLPAYALSHA